MATQNITAQVTSDGSKIIAWGSYGSVRGYGPIRVDRAQAERDVDRDHAFCSARGGYSDRELVAVDDGGACWGMDSWSGEIGGWIAAPGGANGAARYGRDDLITAVQS
jgi:hypothetical protein